jgi:hypothetical protein
MSVSCCTHKTEQRRDATAVPMTRVLNPLARNVGTSRNLIDKLNKQQAAVRKELDKS